MLIKDFKGDELHTGYGVIPNVKVFVHRRPALLDPTYEYSLSVGKGILQAMFWDCDEESPFLKFREEKYETISIFFPERWLYVTEQRELFDRIKYYLPGIKSVEIITASEHILTVTPRDCIAIIEMDYQKCDKAGVTERMTEPVTQLRIAGIL